MSRILRFDSKHLFIFYSTNNSIINIEKQINLNTFFEVSIIGRTFRFDSTHLFIFHSCFFSVLRFCMICPFKLGRQTYLISYT